MDEFTIAITAWGSLLSAALSSLFQIFTAWINLIQPAASISKKGTYDRIRDDRAYLQLEVPLLPEGVRMMDHVLPRELNLDGKVAKLQTFATFSPSGMVQVSPAEQRPLFIWLSSS
jgi:hypothetical protein